MAVDGLCNSVVQVDSVTVPPHPQTNPYANAFRVVEEILTHDSTAARDACAASHRHWVVRSSGIEAPSEDVGNQVHLDVYQIRKTYILLIV